MRRKDREVIDINEILSIIKKCDVCRVAMFDREYPYIVPLNFGFSYDKDELAFYFHCAKSGHKLSLIEQNPKVSFEMDCSHRLITGDRACDYTMDYESVIGNGTMEILDDSQKITALTHLMRQYSSGTSFEFGERQLQAINVLKLTVESVYGKRSKHS